MNKAKQIYTMSHEDLIAFTEQLISHNRQTADWINKKIQSWRCIAGHPETSKVTLKDGSLVFNNITTPHRPPQ